MLLNPAQGGFLRHHARPSGSARDNPSDFSLYNAAYNPLKAYLITTSNNDKSQPKWLTPVMLTFWTGSRNVDQEQQDLAKKQIDFYGSELLRQPPYAITPDSNAVEHTRSYLAKFLGVTRMYQAMLVDGDKAGTPIDFNKQYPGSASFVVDGHPVRGAFSKAGFAFMQDAVKHPEKYAAGEKWVLGDKGGEALTTAVSGSDLWTQYSDDFLKEWRAFLSSARVVNCAGLRDASMRLNALSGPASPLLELFYTVSHNTAVADNKIKSVFQPAQVLVDPECHRQADRPGERALRHRAGQPGRGYRPGLGKSPGAHRCYRVCPHRAADRHGERSVQQASQAFNVDPQTHTEATVAALLKSPIECVQRMAPTPGGAANGGGAKVCAAINALLGKFPFAPNSTVMANLGGRG